MQFGSATASWGGGSTVIGIRNATTAPSSDPTNGGILYVEAGALKYRGASGIGVQLESYAVGDKPLIVKGFASQTANLQEWQNSAGSVLARVDKDGNNYANAFVTPGFEFYSAAENSGGFVFLKKETAAAANPGAEAAKIYFRDGTNAGTLKLVVRAGASGAETTILDNIPQ